MGYYIRLKAGNYYHIYNRGINGENIFKSKKDYDFFFEKYALYLPPVADTYAYCLLKNHFHLLLRIKTEEEQLAYYEKYQSDIYPSFKPLNASRQIGHLCNSFVKKTNAKKPTAANQKQRTGGLFESPFKRKLVTSNAYFTRLVYYIQTNAQRHGFVEDFRDYPHTSYHSFLSKKATKLSRTEVLDWFGGEQYFKIFHASEQDLSSIEDLIIEMD